MSSTVKMPLVLPCDGTAELPLPGQPLPGVAPARPNRLLTSAGEIQILEIARHRGHGDRPDGSGNDHHVVLFRWEQAPRVHRTMAAFVFPSCIAVTDVELLAEGRIGLCDGNGWPARDFEPELRAILKKGGYSTGVGDEGGFAPSLKSNVQALDVVLEAVGTAGFTAGSDVYLALDVAASEFWDNGKYVFKKSGEATRTPDQMVEMYASWVKQYPIISIEDGVAEGDWEGWKALTAAIGDRVQLVGDDVFVTNPKILAEGIAQGVGNSLLVKLNQIGSVTETLRAMKTAWDAGYTTIASHRSGEVTMATDGWFLAAARTIDGPTMSICSTHSSGVAPEATVCVKG